MQIENKLQVGAVALLLSLIAIAGPANSQVSGVEDCDGTNVVPVPPDFTTCLDDAEVDPTGTPCVDTAAEGCPVDLSCAEDAPALDDCAPEGGDPCAAGSSGPADPVCVPDGTLPCPADATVADCLAAMVVPDGCTPGDEDFPQDACLATLDAICALGPLADAPTQEFPTCVEEVASSTSDEAVATVLGLLAPAVTVTAPATATGGDDVVVDILVEATIPVLTAVGEIVVTPPSGTPGAPQTLTLTDGAAEFTVSGVSAGTYTFTVTGYYEEDVTGLIASEASDSTVVAEPPLDLTFTVDSLANQLVDNTVLVTGTVTSNIDTANALIGIALTDLDAAGSGAQNIVWADGEVDTLDLAATSPEAFEALVQWDTQEPVTWTITVTSDDGSASHDVTVTFAGDATYIDFSSGNPPAVLNLAALSATSYDPDNTDGQGVTSTLTLTDNNGAGDGTEASAGRIVDANVDAAIALGDDAKDVVVTTPGTNQPGTPELSRDFAVSVDLPARLKDGTYLLTASYTNPVAEGETGPADLSASVTRSVAVGNVAPVIDVPAAGNFPGTERVPGLGVVAFTVDDFNAGTLESTPVTELASLDVVVREASGGLCTGAVATQGLTLSFPASGGASVVGSTLDFSAVAFDAPIDVSVQVAWGSTAIAGLYEICGTLSDGVDSDADVLLGELGLVALNGGLHLTIDDGGDGLATPKVDPGESTQTEALSIAFTGTQGAESLALTVGTFQRSTGGYTFTASSLTGLLCTTAACDPDDVLAEVNAVSGVVTFPDLSGVTGAGVQLFAVLQFTVPLGSAAGNYAAPITVSVEPIVVP